MLPHVNNMTDTVLYVATAEKLAQRIADHAPLPVLLVKEAVRGMPLVMFTILGAVLAFTASAQQFKPVPALALPRLPHGVVELRVAYVVNPRMPQEPGPQQIDALLAHARTAAREHFGVEIMFTSPREMQVHDIFDKFSPQMRASLNGAVYDFKTGTGDLERMRRSFAGYLRGAADEFDDLYALAQPYLFGPLEVRTVEALADGLLRTHLERLVDFSLFNARFGGKLIDDTPYNELIYWSAAPRLALPFDVIITNQLIASAEYGALSIHSAIRGGVTDGFTTVNPSARFGTTAILSVYPFIAGDDSSRQMRANETYTDDEAMRFAAHVLVHELGHMLFHFGHPHGRASCVMNPPLLLHYRAWVNQLSAADCKPASSAAMTPGFVKFLPLRAAD